MTLNEIIKQSHDNAVNKGFYDNPDKNIGELLMLVVSELGEALEAHRKNRFNDQWVYDFDWYNYLIRIDDKELYQLEFEGSIKDTFEDELADAVIRICDMCGYMRIDLEKHIELKMRYNETREYKHGKAY